MKIHLKRAYDSPSPEDGARFLVDRIWPRGVKKDSLELTAWLKDLAPSHELRRWFGHKPERWESFCERYHKELEANSDALQPLRKAAASGPITLVYSARPRPQPGGGVARSSPED